MFGTRATCPDLTYPLVMVAGKLSMLHRRSLAKVTNYHNAHQCHHIHQFNIRPRYNDVSSNFQNETRIRIGLLISSAAQI